MSNENVSIHDKTTMWATVVMTVATVVMMYSGCQQNRIADIAEERAKREEQRAMTSAKRTVQKAALTALLELPKVRDAQAAKDASEHARTIAEGMDLADNLFLASKPDLAAQWYNFREGFALLALTGQFVFVGPNGERGDTAILKQRDQLIADEMPKFWKLYSELDLAKLYPTNSTK